MLLRTPHLASRTGSRAGFTHRDGGVSEGSLSSLNLALRGGETPERLLENWRRVVAALDPGLDPARVATLHQVHGSRVVEIAAGQGPLLPAAEADAAWTSAWGVVLAVRVADCVPVVFAGPGGVGVIHAGWRGAALGIAGLAIRAYCEGTGDDPADVSAALGPFVSARRFEVGPEVVAALAASGLDPAAFSFTGPAGRPHVDLGAVVRRQLGDAGVGRIESLDACTVGDPRFYSHRRDGEGTGRSAGVIARWPRC